MPLAESLVHHGPAGAPAKTTETKVAKETIFDETLKCAMCMDLCARPITVSPHALPFRWLVLKDHITEAMDIKHMPSLNRESASLFRRFKAEYGVQQVLFACYRGNEADSMCMCCQAPCQHNFCLGCFNKWVGQGKKTCPTCRHAFPAKFAANPRINTLLASAIRMAKLGDRPAAKFVVVSTPLPLGTDLQCFHLGVPWAEMQPPPSPLHACQLRVLLMCAMSGQLCPFEAAL